MPHSVAWVLVLRTKLAFTLTRVKCVAIRLLGLIEVNFPLALAAQISIAELPLEISA